MTPPAPPECVRALDPRSLCEGNIGGRLSYSGTGAMIYECERHAMLGEDINARARATQRAGHTP